MKILLLLSLLLSQNGFTQDSNITSISQEIEVIRVMNFAIGDEKNYKYLLPDGATVSDLTLSKEILDFIEEDLISGTEVYILAKTINENRSVKPVRMYGEVVLNKVEDTYDFYYSDEIEDQYYEDFKKRLNSKEQISLIRFALNQYGIYDKANQDISQNDDARDSMKEITEKFNNAKATTSTYK